MKLFYKSGSCSLAPHIALCESGLNYSLESVDLVTKKTEKGDDFFTINPKGQVPTLQLDDGTILTENAVILQYIADNAENNTLLPSFGSLARYHAMEWLNYIATELHKGFSPLFYSLSNSEMPESYITQTKQSLFKKLDYLNSILSKQEYITGSHFTVADGYLFTVLNWSQFLKIELTPYDGIKNYMTRVTNRPMVIKALKEENLL